MTIEEQLDDMKAAQVDDVKTFYRNFYGIARAEFAAVGDVEAEPLQKQLSQLFNGWKSPAHYARVDANYQRVPTVNQVFETPDKSNSVFVAVQPIEMNDDNPDYAALTLGNYMLGGGFLNSRLATRIRVKDGLSYGVGSYLQIPIAENGSMFLTYAIQAPQNAAKVENDFQEEVSKALKSGFTAQELEAAKSGWLQSRQVSRGQDNELATRLASQAFWGRTMDRDAKLDAAVTALTADRVNAALRKYVDLKQMSYFKAGDFAKVKNAAATPGSSKTLQN